jgi:hypothetical protein
MLERIVIMKKAHLIFALIILSILIVAVPFVSAAKKTPPGKPSSTTSTTPTSTTTQPTVIRETVIINNTQAPSIISQDKPWYADWNFIGVAVALIAALAGWLISRRVRGKTAKYMSEIDTVYSKYNKNTHKCESELVNIKEKIEEDFKKGKINDQSLSLLDSRIEKYSKELRSDIVSKRAMPEDMRKSIKGMLSDGIITKEEYEHFSEALKSSKMNAQDKEEIHKLMKRWKDEDKK